MAKLKAAKNKKDLLNAAKDFEREEGLDRSLMLDGVKRELLRKCEIRFGTSDNVTVMVDPKTCDYHVIRELTVADPITDRPTQVTPAEASMIDKKHHEIGDVVKEEVEVQNIGQVAQNAGRNAIMQKAITMLEEEKNIPREIVFHAIRSAIMTACKNTYDHTDNITIDIDPDTCEYHVRSSKNIVEAVEDPETEISLEEAQEKDGSYKIGEVYTEEIDSKTFGRIAASAARGVMMQDIHEEEHRIILEEYTRLNHTVITGIVQRKIGKSYSINLGTADAILTEREQIRGESYRPNDRYKFYVLDVKDSRRGTKIYVSRTHPDLVRRLFEQEVVEIRDGIVEIKNIAREAGNRTKMAVWSNDENVDPVGACVGMNGTRVNAVVEELHNEKIDIINWDETPARLIENALSPAKVISVIADSEEKTAKVVVPDYQLSLAIGREGQNARLAARLTGYKIDIKSETQARESGDFFDMDEEYYDEDGYYEDEDGDLLVDDEAADADDDLLIDDGEAAPEEEESLETEESDESEDSAETDSEEDPENEAETGEGSQNDEE
jgi:N utilization substance protein A